MTETHRNEQAIFNGALELPPAERGAYLLRATKGDAALRQRIEALLYAYEAGDFLEQAAAPEWQHTGSLSAPLTEKPGDKIGRYKLLQQIGEGGCGVVYMAEQEEPVRRRVALKIIKLGMDTKSVVARFEAERQALAMMEHPNIAQVFDAGATETGRPYFVMELVRGVKITAYCDEAGLPIRARLELFLQVCQAVQHAHQKGIIHRDIKPSNILVTVNDGVGVPKVIDFGIAKATSGRQLTDKTVFTAFEQFIGTPAYMSPEQTVMTSVDIDTRSDIYSLGVLLYELLIGKTPFDSKELLVAGLEEMRRTICEKEPDRPSSRLTSLSGQELSTTAQRRGLDAPKLASQLRGDLDWVVMRCLEKDRSRRYETANGLSADIKRHLAFQPVVARPPSAAYRAQRWVQRNKLAFAAATGIALALLLGLYVSTTLFLRERAALREQVRLRVLAETKEREARLQNVLNRAILAGNEISGFIKTTNFIDADSMLQQLLTTNEVTNPENAPLLAVRATGLARRGRFHESARDYALLLQMQTGEIEHYFQFAPLLLINGDLTGYRHVCHQMLAKFGDTIDAGVADPVLKTCCLLPPLEDHLPKILHLAEIVGKGESSSRLFNAGGALNNIPWYHLTLGLAAYRQGNYPAAVDWTTQTLNEPLRFSDDMRYYAAYMVLAMARFRLGHLDHAHKALADGLDLAEAKLPGLDSGNLGPMWQNLFHGHILMREAKALISGGTDAYIEQHHTRSRSP